MAAWGLTTHSFASSGKAVHEGIVPYLLLGLLVLVPLRSEDEDLEQPGEVVSSSSSYLCNPLGGPSTSSNPAA